MRDIRQIGDFAQNSGLFQQIDKQFKARPGRNAIVAGFHCMNMKMRGK
jgi:hypothetical protein